MTSKLVWLLLACSVQGLVKAQESDVTEIPSDTVIDAFANHIEGSGSNALGEEVTEQSVQPKLEPVIPNSEDDQPNIESLLRFGGKVDEQIDEANDPVMEEKQVSTEENKLSIPPVIEDEKHEENSTPEIPCPKSCLCSIEGHENNLVVNCAGSSLTEFPSPLDSRTSTLNLNNNKLTEIPNDISALKNLKVLNANDNSIMELSPGSISELPELIKLDLANNRLIEYPQDLKNSIILTKLEELDLGGNDIRTVLTPELFSPLKSLRKVTLPTTKTDFLEDLCIAFKSSLETVCAESCKEHTFECPDATANIEKDLFDATLPGMIAFDTIHSQETSDTVAKNDTKIEILAPEPTKEPEITSTTTEFSLRSAVNEEPLDKKAFNSLVEAPKDTVHDETEVKIGAKTSETPKQAGGVDRSVIGIVIAGMIVVVAAIAIKKNWSSIRKKFSSNPRPNDRTPHTNGNAPEEVPLQEKANDKSPV
ncbi:unnamed protein product [Leptosia nina]|uniref:LRRNT domain-containing protein n=1 Tax=Leptosia nina TaxID=320188 RepID=A0AAV1JNV3_9NEOP